jgi:protein TonB
MLRLLAVAGVHGMAMLSLWLFSDWRPFSSSEPLMIELVSSGAEVSYEAFMDLPAVAVESSVRPPVIVSQVSSSVQAQPVVPLQETMAPTLSDTENEGQSRPSSNLSSSSTLAEYDVDKPILVKEETEVVNPVRPIQQPHPAPSPRFVEPALRPPPQPPQPPQSPQSPQSDRAVTRPTATAAVSLTVPDVAPKPISSPKPPYPLSAFKVRQEGRVVLELEVLEDGAVGQVRLAQSSAFESLDASALATVKKWKYSPAHKNGQIVKQWIRVSILFEVQAR